MPASAGHLALALQGMLSREPVMSLLEKRQACFEARVQGAKDAIEHSDNGKLPAEVERSGVLL